MRSERVRRCMKTKCGETEEQKPMSWAGMNHARIPCCARDDNMGQSG
jgi:hypothetical protein